jgi:hypothetical protein
MDLFNDERKLSEPPNYGEQLFQKSRLLDKAELTCPTFCFGAPGENVRYFLEQCPDIKGPLDATEVLNHLSPDDLCDFFSRYNECESLSIRDWRFLPAQVLRCIAVTMGGSLQYLDVSGSHIGIKDFEILLAFSKQLKGIRISGCPNIDGLTMALLSKISHATMSEFYAEKCPSMRVEPLLWLAGSVGFTTYKCGHLKIVDLGECPVEDKGLIGLAAGCKNIRFLNLTRCPFITDLGVAAILSVSTKLRVLNVSSCPALSNKTIMCLAANCKKLVSLNISGCIKISDKAMQALSMHCAGLQGLNVAGLKKISELGIYWLADKCKGLIMLNVTGCDLITVNGLCALIQGMSFVEPAKTFTGFKPVDEHIDKKLASQLMMIKDSAMGAVLEVERNKEIEKAYQKKVYNELINAASSTIAGYLRRYKCRMRFYWMWMDKRMFACALFIQRGYRGYRGRIKAKMTRIRRAEYTALVPALMLLQAVVRGNGSRRRNIYVNEVLIELYGSRKREADVGLAVRLQSCARRYLAKQRVRVWREFKGRRHADETRSALTIQKLCGTWLYTRRYDNRKMREMALFEVQMRAANKLIRFSKSSLARKRAKIARREVIRQRALRLVATYLLQRQTRGFWGRNKAYKARIANAAKYHAAMTVQRFYRGASVLHWRDMRLNIIAAFVLDRHYVERRARVADSRVRYLNYLEDVKRDSASESEDEAEEEVQWSKGYDPKLRCPFWRNEITNDVTYEEPRDVMAEKRLLFGARLRVYWVVQDAWYEGVLVNYHKRKQRFRLDYDDSDHEWLDIYREKDRIQIQLSDGSWVMFSQYKTVFEDQDREKKLEKGVEDESKAQAYEDAYQWKILSESVHDTKVLYISEKTGEIRIGVFDAAMWTIEDDGYGFPCFYHSETGHTEHEDPRFTESTPKDLAIARSFVMQELRYAVFFCKDYLLKYESAQLKKNAREIKLVSRMISKSDKPKQMNAFYLRAKALYQHTSVVDKPFEHNIDKELAYIDWLSQQMAFILAQGEEVRRENEEGKRIAVQRILGDKAGGMTVAMMYEDHYANDYVTEEPQAEAQGEGYYDENGQAYDQSQTYDENGQPYDQNQMVAYEGGEGQEQYAYDANAYDQNQSYDENGQVVAYGGGEGEYQEGYDQGQLAPYDGGEYQEGQQEYATPYDQNQEYTYDPSQEYAAYGADGALAVADTAGVD